MRPDLRCMMILCTPGALLKLGFLAHAAAVENEHMRHLSQCPRPPLAACTEVEFEEDLYNFLTHRGEVELANDLRNKRINWCGSDLSCDLRMCPS